MISVLPDPEEKKAIKKHYMKPALALLADIFIFQCVSRATVLLAGLSRGSSLMNAYEEGRNAIFSNEILEVLYTIGFPIVAEVVCIMIALKYLGFDIKKKFTRDGVSMKDISGGFAVSIMGQTTAALILSIIALIFSKTEDFAQVAQALNSRSSMLANFLLYFYACLLGPVLEEIIFRGIVLDSMKEYNERFAIVFSSLIFGLMHCNFPQAINAFIIGLIFGTLYIRSGSLLPSVILHILMNTITSLSQVMTYSSPDIADKLMHGDLSALSGLPVIAIALNGALRLLAVPFGIAVLVIAGKNHFGLRKAAPAGKSRSAPLVFSSPAWIAVIVIYFGFCCYNL